MGVAVKRPFFAPVFLTGLGIILATQLNNVILGS